MTYVKNFADSEEKYLKTVVLFGKTADSTLYIDAAYTTKAVGAAVVDMFTKGMVLVNYEDALYTPAILTEDEGDVTVTIFTVGDASAFTPVELTTATE